MALHSYIGALLLFASCISATPPLHPLSDEFISLINSKQNAWTAGRNFPSDTSMAYIKGLMGSLQDDHLLTLPIKVHDPDLIKSLPENFDPRDKWPNCPTLNDIRDQGSCGSCWAFAAVEAMTDRVCTYSNGTKNFYFSAQDLISCCEYCGRNGRGDGCHGGSASNAWEYARHSGLVSGGSYNSAQGCISYKVPPCEHHMAGERINCFKTYVNTPSCVHQCEAGYNVTYGNDKHFFESVYSISGEENIKAELFMNGPVEASIKVKEDFYHYKSGVYRNEIGKNVSFHSVKLLGWGVEDGHKYWLAANSWNTDWGNNGFIKILRGENANFLGRYTVAGAPKLDGIRRTYFWTSSNNDLTIRLVKSKITTY